MTRRIFRSICVVAVVVFACTMVLIMDLEDQFNMTVDDAAIGTMKTVGDVVRYIESKQ